MVKVDLSIMMVITLKEHSKKTKLMAKENLSEMEGLMKAAL